MRLDGTALQNIRINGSLRQELDSGQFSGFFFKYPNKFGSDNFPLLFRFGNAGQLVQEPVRRVDINQIGLHLIAEHFNHLLRLPFTQQSMVDMYTNQLLADGLDQQRGNNGRIHSAGKRQQHFFIPNLFF